MDLKGPDTDARVRGAARKSDKAIEGPFIWKICVGDDVVVVVRSSS